jgi:hypothetical protein
VCTFVFDTFDDLLVVVGRTPDLQVSFVCTFFLDTFGDLLVVADADVESRCSEFLIRNNLTSEYVTCSNSACAV